MLKVHVIVSGRRTRQAGLSIIELMVGSAVGLILLAGVISLFVSNLHNSRRMLIEARVNQDLRVTADLIARDLRRAGYWGNALKGVTVIGAALTPERNPYGTVTPDTANSEIDYTFSRDATENDTVDTAENFGFRLNGQTVQMRIGSTWQTVTDPNVLSVTGLSLTRNEIPVDARSSCAKTCTGGSCPTVTVRYYRLVLSGQAVADTAVTRTLQTTVRVRNDLLAGTCPA